MTTVCEHCGSNPSDTEAQFVNAAEIGRALSLRKSQVYSLANRGLLPHVRFGRRILFPRSALSELKRFAITQAIEVQQRLRGSEVSGAAE